MKMTLRWLLVCSAVFMSTTVAPLRADAWGVQGHTIIGQAAMAHLPADLPGFMRSGVAKSEIAYLQGEEDRLKIAEVDEKAWVRQWTTDHYVDVGDDNRIAGVVGLTALPDTREGYIAALARSGKDAYKFGFVPYSILEGYEQVRSDFALWRLAKAAQRTSARIEGFSSQEIVREREALTIHDIGIFSHFVADASQPLHVSVHFNGWGRYPNPNGFSDSRTTHNDFEDSFVGAYLHLDDVSPLVGPAQVFDAIPLTQIESYIAASVAQVAPFYELDKRRAFAMRDSASALHREGVGFAAARMAAGATMLNSLIETAWRTSQGMKPVD